VTVDINGDGACGHRSVFKPCRDRIGTTSGSIPVSTGCLTQPTLARSTGLLRDRGNNKFLEPGLCVSPTSTGMGLQTCSLRIRFDTDTVNQFTDHQLGWPSQTRRAQAKRFLRLSERRQAIPPVFLVQPATEPSRSLITVQRKKNFNPPVPMACASTKRPVQIAAGPRRVTTLAPRAAPSIFGTATASVAARTDVQRNGLYSAYSHPEPQPPRSKFRPPSAAKNTSATPTPTTVAKNPKLVARRSSSPRLARSTDATGERQECQGSTDQRTSYAFYGGELDDFGDFVGFRYHRVVSGKSAGSIRCGDLAQE